MNNQKLKKIEVIDGITYYESEMELESRDFAKMISIRAAIDVLDDTATMIDEVMKTKKEWSRPLAYIGMAIVEEMTTLHEESNKMQDEMIKKLELSEEESKNIYGLSINANNKKLTIMKREEV